MNKTFHILWVIREKVEFEETHGKRKAEWEERRQRPRASTVSQYEYVSEMVISFYIQTTDVERDND